jgi:hypothetical protein
MVSPTVPTLFHGKRHSKKGKGKIQQSNTNKNTYQANKQTKLTEWRGTV